MKAIEPAPVTSLPSGKEPVSGNLVANGILQFLHYVFPIVTLPYVGHVAVAAFNMTSLV